MGSFKALAFFMVMGVLSAWADDAEDCHSRSAWDDKEDRPIGIWVFSPTLQRCIFTLEGTGNRLLGSGETSQGGGQNGTYQGSGGGKGYGSNGGGGGQGGTGQSTTSVPSPPRAPARTETPKPTQQLTQKSAPAPTRDSEIQVTYESTTKKLGTPIQSKDSNQAPPQNQPEPKLENESNKDQEKLPDIT